MDNSGEGEVSRPHPQQRQNDSAGGLAAQDKPGKILMADDEGIGGSETNTPRPGSAMAMSEAARPPATTVEPQKHADSVDSRPGLSQSEVGTTESSPQSSASVVNGVPPDVEDNAPVESPSKQSEGSPGSTLGSSQVSIGAEIDAVAELNKDHNDEGAGLGASGGSGLSQSSTFDAGNAFRQTESPSSGNSGYNSTSPSQLHDDGPNGISASSPSLPPPRTAEQASDSSSATTAAAMDIQFSQQLQHALSALEDYRNRFKNQGEVLAPDEEEEEALKKTLEKVTLLCQTCSSTSASLGQQLQQARQLTDSINKDLSQKLQSDNLRDWVPPGYCKEEGETLPEEQQAAERKRLARAAESRAAVARASHAMQAKSQELARAEADLMDAELAAAAAVEVAEEAVQQLEAARSAQEAKQREEERKNEASEEAEEKQTGGEENDAEKEEAFTEQGVEESSPQEDQGDEQKEEGEMDTIDASGQLQEENCINDETDLAETPQEERENVELEKAQDNDEQRSDNGFTPDELNCNQEDGQEELAVNEHTDDPQQADQQQEEVAEKRIEFKEPNRDEEYDPEPELTTQKVFQEVHVVHETGVQNGVQLKMDDFSRFIYSLEPGDWDTGLGCVIRTAGTQGLGRDDLEVTRVHPAVASLPLSDSEELVSNIVLISTTADTTTLSGPLSVALPHCAPRLHPGREPVVRMRPLTGGRWRDLYTTDASFDDIKEHKFVEAKLKGLGTVCVVLRLKREGLQIPARHGGKFMASGDSRVSLTWLPKTVKTTIDMAVAVQLLDQNVVADLRTRTDVDLGHLMSSSPVVHCQTQGKGTELLRPLTVSLPCPPNPAARVQRPKSSLPQRKPEKVAVDNEDGTGNVERPATARPFFTMPKKEEVTEEEVHVLWRRDTGPWVKLQDVQFLQSRKKDIVIFELHSIVPRLLLLRTRAGLAQNVVERIASTLEHVMAHLPVQIVLKQHAHYPSKVALTCATSLNGPPLERALRELADEGYTQGPAPTVELRLREGQLIDVSFRGNLKQVEEDDDDEGDCTRGSGRFVPRCAFHSNIPFRLRFSVEEIDKFAQKGFDRYRGFVQLSTFYTPPLRRGTSAGAGIGMAAGDGGGGSGSGGGGGGVQPAQAIYFRHGRHLLAELMASLPKPEPETPRPLNTAPVSLKSYGPITSDLLRHVAQQLAADDWRRLAPMLNVRRTRLQAILRQNMSTPAWLPIYDVLLTWSKRLPQAFDRVDMLCAALMAVGRNDLVEEVRDKENGFRQDHYLSIREAMLHKAFVRIARHEKAVSQWRRLALFLGVSEEEVKAIAESTCSARERCIQSLKVWKDSQDSSGEDVATVKLLSHKLRLCRYRALAKEIDAIR